MKTKLLTIIALGLLFSNLNAQTYSLDSCKTLAIENNKKITEAQLKINESEQVKKSAFTHYFPNVSAGASAMKSSDYFLQGNIPETQLPVFDAMTGTQLPYFTLIPEMPIEAIDYANLGFVMAVQPVYMGGRIINGNKLANIGLDVSKHQLNLTKDEVLLKTEELFWTAISLDEKMKTLLSYEQLLDTLLRDATVSHEAGLIQKGDLLKVQLKKNEIEANKIKLRNGIKMVNMAICQHIGMEYTNSFKLEAPLESINDPVTFKFNPAESVQNREEYKMLNKAIEAEVLQKKITHGEHLPQLAIGAAGLYMDMMDHETTNGMAFATLNIPISDWWGGSHKIKEHKIKIESARNRLAETSELLILQINDAYNALNESYDQIKVAEKSVEQAEEHYNVENNNYEAGIVSTSELLEAQAMYQETLNNLVDAKSTYKIKEAHYLKVIATYNL